MQKFSPKYHEMFLYFSTSSSSSPCSIIKISFRCLCKCLTSKKKNKLLIEEILRLVWFTGYSFCMKIFWRLYFLNICKISPVFVLFFSFSLLCCWICKRIPLAITEHYLRSKAECIILFWDKVGNVISVMLFRCTRQFIIYEV